MLKKLCLACAFVVLSASTAFAACTIEEFQKEVTDMQGHMTALSQDQAKFQKVNEEFEKLFSAELMEFAQFAQTAAGDPAKQQEMLDKGCDLYGRMNKKLEEYK